MYKVNDLIIYGSYGVCNIDSIGVPDIPGIDSDKLYYTLSPLYHSEKVFTPVDTNVYTRPVISQNEAKHLISQIPTIRENLDNIDNIKILEGYYKETLQSHNCSDLLKLIKTIFTRARIIEDQGKKLGQIDKRFMTRAEDQLYGELAVALKLPKEEVKTHVEEKIKEQENLCSAGV